MRTDPKPGGRLSYGAQLLALTAVYVVLGRLGLMMSPVNGFATLVWPPSGIALAALLICGYRLWPAVAVGALATNLWLGAPPLVACGIAAGNTLEAVGGTFALQRIPGFRGSLARFRDVLGLATLAAAASTTVSATVGTASLALGGVITAAQLIRTWHAWWVGDFIGDLIVAPMILTWACGPRLRARPRVVAQAAALFALLVGCSVLVFFQRPWIALAPEPRAVVPILQPNLVFLPLTWAALRHGARGAATGTFLVAITAVWATSTGHGPFTLANHTDSLASLHVFLASASFTSLILGAVVSERRRSRTELGERESLLRAIMSGTADAIYVKDRDGRYVIMNAAGAWLFGLPAEAMTGKDDFALFPAEEARLLREIDHEVMRTAEPHTYEESLTIGDQIRVFHTTKTPYRDPVGNVLGVVGIARDITERQSEEMARAWLAAIVESSTDAVIGKTLDGTITSWNAAAQRLYGYPAEEVIGRHVSMLAPEDRRGEIDELLDRIRRGERIADHETLRLRKDGTRVDVSITMSPVHDSTGALIGCSVIARDLSERQEQLRLAIEAAHLGIWFWNVKSGRLVWTPRCRSMHGLASDEDVCFERFLATLHPGDRERTEHTIRRAIEAGIDYRIEHRVVCPDGSVRWISVLGRVVCGDTGKPTRMLGVAMDITAEKQAEQERAELLEREQAARAEAQAATRAKDEFLAVLSHELRTPLQSMLGWTQILRAGSRDERTLQKGLATIERNARTQAQLIEDLLDVSRIVAGKLRIEKKRVDLIGVVEAALETAKAAADARSVRLEATLSELTGEVIGDPDRLQQVVSNLLSNAVKFTPGGGHVSVRLDREDTTATIVVEDTGRGISPELLPFVFDRFRQADTTTTRSFSGLGLGLAIVRHLVEMHGGTVVAESAGEGKGARFVVTLPLVGTQLRAVAAERRRPESEGPRGHRTLEGVRVLVVDDDPDTRELLETVLHESGADVHAVGSAHAALDEIASYHPDLLLSDIRMPEEDGYALIREVRAREHAGGGHVPAVALTAFASQADREQALELGFEEHLAKPVTAGELASTVARLVKRAA